MAERFDQERASQWNREPGIVVIPDSNYAKEMQKYEQYPSKYGGSPGNPYRYRPFPKMVYRAELWKGKPVCMAAQPDPSEFPNPNDVQRVEEQVRRFNERCQLIVRDEAELQKAKENGYREDPAEAVAYLEGRQRSESEGAAVRAFEDRNMSEPAKAEARAEALRVFDEEGRHAPEIAEKPKKRRGRPPKNPAAA
jgi:hypothetical protein